ncbi:MAG TPA: phosphoglycerate mutase family protein [Cyclobacteriaceae bacterium]|mgnify:CR=1 FL=1|nr:phosphoglycerate mutase family protein [Cyclobacteriaceae bacterium]HPW64471.1 phosphoglycerate mutase family protein [Cyclobacteriaceae bacterium]
MKYIFLFVVLISFSIVQAQPTTFILVRHAEKGNDGTKDPDLTEAGTRRAQLLATMLKKTQVDAIYSTAYKRTRNTVSPLATTKGLSVSGYEAFKTDEIDQILKKHTGGTVVIAGHSNNIPWIANYLTGKETYKDFEDSDYENLLIVTVVEKGKNAKVVWLSY